MNLLEPLDLNINLVADIELIKKSKKLVHWMKDVPILTDTRNLIAKKKSKYQLPHFSNTSKMKILL